MTARFETTLHARWNDMDFNAHMGNSAFLDAASDVRMQYFASVGFRPAEFAKLRVGPVVRRDELEYFRELRLLEPFRAAHAIYVRQHAARFDAVDTVPAALRRRVLSLRGFDARGYLVDADLASGDGIEGKIEALLADPLIHHVDAHYAKPGCFAARIERA